jgi:hypothetical protein
MDFAAPAVVVIWTKTIGAAGLLLGRARGAQHAEADANQVVKNCPMASAAAVCIDSITWL